MVSILAIVHWRRSSNGALLTGNHYRAGRQDVSYKLASKGCGACEVFAGERRSDVEKMEGCQESLGAPTGRSDRGEVDHYYMFVQ